MADLAGSTAGWLPGGELVEVVFEVGVAVAVRVGVGIRGGAGIQAATGLPAVGHPVVIGIVGDVVRPVLGPGVRPDVGRGVDDAGEVALAPPEGEGPVADLADDAGVDGVLPREVGAD